jgi:Peptidase family M48
MTVSDHPRVRAASRWCFSPTRPVLSGASGGSGGPRSKRSACALVLALAALPPVFAAAQPSPPSAASAPSYAPGGQVRFGNTAIFRNLVPSAVVDAQSAVEYRQLVDRARADGRLLPATDPRVDRVRAIAQRIAPFADKWSDRIKDWRWEVNVVRSPRIDIACLPGGKILVYSGLLERIRLRDDELGVLFGHQIAHALREQVRERLAQQATGLGSSPMPQLFGVTELYGTPASAPTIDMPLAPIQYDATDETEADVIGNDIAARAGFDPRAAVPLWDKLARATRHNENGFILAHPYSEARRSDIIKRLPDILELYAKTQGVPVDQLPPFWAKRSPSGSAGRPR